MYQFVMDTEHVLTQIHVLVPQTTMVQIAAATTVMVSYLAMHQCAQEMDNV